MSKSSLHLLAWSQEDRLYQMYTDRILQQCCGLDETEALWDWLETCTSVSFQGQKGHLTLLKERRTRGGGYWYAYGYRGQGKIKRYLGTTRKVTLPSLEEVAAGFIDEQSTSVERSSAPAAAPLPGAFLLPKLSPPRLPADLVMRERLLTRLDQTLTHTFTLLSASAGSGKTTLLASWVRRVSSAVAWLALDEQDNDPVRFWMYVIAALRTCQPVLGTNALTLLRGPRPPDDPAMMNVLTAFINDLVAFQEDLVLILEDVHLIEEAAIHDGLQFFLNHLPPHCHLVFSTRFDPPWSLARFRARRQMVELRDADLRFISSEATAFLRQSTGDLLTEEEIQLLQVRTEGWGVALHLAVLALANHEDHLAYVQRLDGSQRFLLEYMQEEILERQPEALQRFLLQTSILNRLQADLCRAVTGEPASELLLADLERRHLFLVPLDDARQWYRFHALFRDMLLNRLRTALPEQVAQLHKRAAIWYEEQGLLVEAITHAFEANDTSYTVDLLERFIVPRSWHNEYHTLRRWLKRLPAEVLYSRPELTFMFVSTIVLSLPHGPETLSQVEEPLSQAERGFRASLNQAGLAAVLTLRAILMCFQDDFAGAFTLAHEAIALFPQDDARWHGQCLTLLGIEASFAGQQAQASQFLRQGLVICQNASSLPGILFSSAFLGDYYLGQGKLQQAARVFHQALTTLYAQPDLIKSQLTLESGVREIYHERLIYYGLAMCAYEQNDLAEAERLLREALLWGQFSWLHMLTPGLLLQVRLLTALGKAQQANTFLSEMAEQEYRSEVLHEISLSQVWLALHMGDLELAQQHASSATRASEPVPLVRREQETLLFARLQIQEGRLTAALDLLTPARQEARARERRYSEVQILILEALAHEIQGEREQASAALLQACRQARSENYQRLFLDEGERIEILLKVLLRDLPEGVLATYVQSLLRSFAAIHAPSDTVITPNASLLPEPLTPQEQRVLHLLADGASNQEIADQLIISLTTAKKHVANILSKLGVQNRTQAVVRAREYTLI